MVPFLWGPMAWRQIHGMAHAFDRSFPVADTKDNISEKVAELFVLFLIALAWVLPCNLCRLSYSDYLLGFLQNGKLAGYFNARKVQRFAFELHNMVNEKLNRPVCDNFDLVLRRSELWSVEFLPRELFGLLFIITLNFNSNQESEKQKHYKEFFLSLPHLLAALGNQRMAVALEQHINYSQVWTQENLLQSVYSAFATWQGGHVPDIAQVEQMYNLCRA